MAYTKQTWSDYPATSTPINASRLNHIEEGIYDSSMCGPAFDALANEWTTSATYEVGDYVYYNSDVYRCLVSNTATLPTTESTWEKVKIGSELSQLNENIAKYKSKGNSTKGVYFDANGNVLETNTIPSVSNVLTSTSTTDALSANQGKVLKDLINTLTLSPTFVSKSGTVSRATELTINTHRATKNIPIAYVNMSFSVVTNGRVNVYAKRSDGQTILEKTVNGDAWQNGGTVVDLSFITSLSNGQYVTLYAYTWDNSSAVNWSANISTNIS